MRYASFSIENFKGIQLLALDFNDLPKVPIITLVGLNESGKTTILEALSFFQDNVGADETETRITPGVVNDIHDLIPKRLKGNFNGAIKITANIVFDQDDITKIQKFFFSKGIQTVTVSDNLKIEHAYNFKNSRQEKNTRYWTLNIAIKEPRQRNPKKLGGTHPLWNDFCRLVRSRLPPNNILSKFPL